VSLADEMKADIAEMIADLPASFSYKGASYNCTCSPVGKTARVDPEGIFNNYDIEIVAAVWAGTKPPVKDVVQVTDAALELSAVNYWIMDSIIDAGGLTLRLRRGRE
jgi:hypothetical protein